MKKSILPLIPIVILVFLLFFPSLAFEGAKSGLLLWFNVVLPTLLPFMLCSGLIVSWNGVSYLTRPLSPVFKLLRLSPEGGYAFLCGLLCGYPMGAKTAADFVKEGRMTAAEGKRLLAIAAFPSPMFLAGYIQSCLPESVSLLHTSAALYLPILILSFLSYLIYNRGTGKSGRKAPDRTAQKSHSDMVSTTFDDALLSALEIMVKIGGYIMMFSILALFAEHFLPAHSLLKPIFVGMVEMTTGIRFLSTHLTGPLCGAGIIFAAAFGGICGIFQTNTVIKNAGLSIRHYVLWKLLHASLSGTILILLSW